MHTLCVCRVNCVEHLLAALEASGVNNARIEIRGDEIPFLDGSARPFMRLIHIAGTIPAPTRPGASPNSPEVRAAVPVPRISFCTLDGSAWPLHGAHPHCRHSLRSTLQTQFELPPGQEHLQICPR